MITRLHTQDALEILRKGGVVVFPTETAYGLAADAGNPLAVERVLAIKGREGKSFPLIAASFAMANRYVRFSPHLRDLARRFWPGALTIVAPVKENDLAPAVIREGTVAIRVSSHPVARALSRGLGRPIVSTSANVSGKEECYSVQDVKRQFQARPLQPDYYFDEGPIPKRAPSTIVIEKDGELVVLRQGSVSI